MSFGATPCLMRSGPISTPMNLPWPTRRVSLMTVHEGYLGEAVYRRTGERAGLVLYEFERAEA